MPLYFQYILIQWPISHQFKNKQIIFALKGGGRWHAWFIRQFRTLIILLVLSIGRNGVFAQKTYTHKSQAQKSQALKSHPLKSNPLNAHPDKLNHVKSEAVDSAAEGTMLNEVKDRDQVAIDSALNGWWTASMQNHEQRISWWREAKFGMFLHWGVYSEAAGAWQGKPVPGYAEHLMRIKKIPRSVYLNLAHHFNPVQFNADTWVKQAKKAGMRYLIITAKHHDGFAMYDSKVSDYNIVKQSAYHKDPMVALSAACKKYGLKFGFYYSHAFDWEHPDAPGNDWDYDNPGGDKKIGGEKWYDNHPEWLPRIQRYVNEKAIPQIKELIQKYHPDILWFDTPHKLPLSENLRILKAIRATDTASEIVINGRLARISGRNFGDYQNTADRPAAFYPVQGDWEAIPTTNESYGYSKFDLSHKPASHFIRLLASAASRGGNLLMNIGPMGSGAFDPKDIKILNGIGAWMAKNDSSIYGTQRSPLPLQSWGVITTKANKIFLHVFEWPKDGHLYVGGLKSPVNKAYLLANQREIISVKRINPLDIMLKLPTRAEDDDTANTVIVLELKDHAPTIQADSLRYVSTNISLSRLLAYDATQHGGKFGFGDGKANRYYVSGWKSKDQYVEWTFRTDFPAQFNIQIKYVSDVASGGRYMMSLDDYQVNRVVDHKPSEKNHTDDGGTVDLPAGIHHLTIKAEAITGPELMKLLEIQLRPLQKD